MPVDIKPRILTTAIDSDDPNASIDLAFANAGYFGLALKDARATAAGIAQAVSHWRDVAERTGLSRAACIRMASAFEHEDQRIAQGMFPQK